MSLALEITEELLSPEIKRVAASGASSRRLVYLPSDNTFIGRL